jgi:hypothetical protein
MMGFLLGLAIGAIASAVLTPLLAQRFPRLAKLVNRAQAQALPMTSSLAARIDAAIAELESQIAQGLDRERNGTRLAILREIRGE